MTALAGSGGVTLLAPGAPHPVAAGRAVRAQPRGVASKRPRGEPPSELEILAAALRDEVVPHDQAHRDAVVETLRRFAERCALFGRVDEHTRARAVIERAENA